MRPVDKGAGAGYTPATTLQWNKLNNKNEPTAAWTALHALTGNNKNPMILPLTDCLELALTVVVKAHPSATETTAKNAIIDKATEIYKTAAGPLATAVGTFCSYCETAIPGLLEVEHVAPKASYPTLMTKWENFLLSCGPCNNIKRENPNRAAAAVNPPPPALDPVSGTDAAFYDKIRDMYAWPDWWNGTFQFFPIDFQMSPDNGATWQSMSLADASNLQNNYLVSQDLNTRAIRADIVHGGHPCTNVLVAAVVQPWNQNLVQLCGLNNPGNAGGNKTYDRRLYNRTLAWFQILETMRPLMNIDDEQTFLQLWPVIQYASVSTGFWSLWVTLLSQFNDFATPPRSLGYWLYKDNNASTFYPGTKTTNIVLPPRQ